MLKTILFSAMLFAPSSFAGLIGANATAFYDFPSGPIMTSFGSATVSGAVEFPSVTIPLNHTFSIDVTNSTIVLTYLPGNTAVGPNGVSFNGFEIDFTSLTGEILSVSADTSSTMAFRGVSTSNNAVFLDLGGVILQPNTTLIVDTTLGSVPEPATSACVALVLAFMASRLIGRARIVTTRR